MMRPPVMVTQKTNKQHQSCKIQKKLELAQLQIREILRVRQ